MSTSTTADQGRKTDFSVTARAAAATRLERLEELREPRRRPPVEDPFDDVGGEEREPQDAADVRSADPFGVREFGQRAKSALLQQPLPSPTPARVPSNARRLRLVAATIWRRSGASQGARVLAAGERTSSGAVRRHAVFEEMDAVRTRRGGATRTRCARFVSGVL